MSSARPSRTLATVVVGLLLALPLVRMAGSDSAVMTTLAVTIGFIDLVILPALLLLVAFSSTTVSAATLGTSIAVTPALAQLALLPLGAASIPTLWLTLATWGATLSGAVALWIRPPRSTGPLAIPLLLALVGGASLYLQPAAIGPPGGSTEEVVAVRRMTYLSPSADAVNWTSVPPRQPLSATTMQSAMIARATGVDPVVVHDKARALWAAASLLVIYALSARLFGSPTVALVSMATMVVLALSGALPLLFGIATSRFTLAGQVAITVIVPALAIFLIGTVGASQRLTAALSGLAFIASLYALAIASPPDSTQAVVYLGVACVLLGSRWPATAAGLAATLTLTTIGIPWLHTGLAVAADSAQALALREEVLATLVTGRLTLLQPGWLEGSLGRSATALLGCWWAVVSVTVVLLRLKGGDVGARLGRAIVVVLLAVSFWPPVAITYAALYSVDVYAIQARHWQLWGALAAGSLVMLATHRLSPKLDPSRVSWLAAGAVILAAAVSAARLPAPTAWTAHDYRREFAAFPPPAGLLDFARRQLDHTGRILHNVESPTLVQALIPQRLLLWQVDGAAGEDFNARYFPKEWALFTEARSREGEQPFFGTTQSDDVRARYAKALEATHVLVDPHVPGIIKDRLHRIPWLHLMFDQDGWSLYEISGPGLEDATR
jgi:hypothetical protein